MWIQDKTWKLITEKKRAKSLRDLAKRAQEGGKRAAQYLAIDRRVKKSSADKKEWLQRKGADTEAAESKNDTRALYYIIGVLTGTRSN